MHEFILKFLGIALTLHALFLVVQYLLLERMAAIDFLKIPLLGVSVLLGFVGAIIWHRKDSQIPSEKLHYGLQAVVRYTLAFIFVIYSFAKFYGTQFGPPRFNWLDTPLGDLTGFQLTWSFFGSSPAYGAFIGLSQFAAAILLLFRKTQLLGACILFPIIANIVFVNFAFDIPVKWNSVFFLTMAGYLVFAEFPRLKALFWDNKPIGKRNDDVFDPRRKKLFYGAKFFLITSIIAYNFWFYESLTAKYPTVEQPIAGIWQVQEFEQNGEVKQMPKELKSIWTTMIFEEQTGGNQAIIKSPVEQFNALYSLDTADKTLNFQIRKQSFAGHYELMGDTTLTINGTMEQDSLRITLNRKR